MVCRSLSDPVWEELQDIMKKKRGGVKARKIIATSWKLRTSASWRKMPGFRKSLLNRLFLF